MAPFCGLHVRLMHEEISPAPVCRDKIEGLSGIYPSSTFVHVLVLLSDVQTTH